MLDLTIGIVTDGNNSRRVSKIIDSLAEQKYFPKNLHIVVCGGNFGAQQPDLAEEGYYYSYTHIPFDESLKFAHITKKKNLIVQAAKFDNVVLMHDYITFDPYWFDGLCLFDDECGGQWDLMMTKVLNLDGSRFRDWCYWTTPGDDREHTVKESWCPDGIKFKGRPSLAPYTVPADSNFYYSGSYIITKKWVFEKWPLDESLDWGQGEDLKHSLEVIPNVRYKFNPYSTVKSLKQKDLGIGVLPQ